MNAFTAAGVLTALSSVGFGLFVFAQNPRRTLYRVWLVFTLSVAIWGAGAAAISLAHAPEASQLAWRLAFGLGVIWIPPLFFNFAAVFCERPMRRFFGAMLAAAIFFSCAVLFTPYFFAAVRPVFGFYYGVPYWPVFIVFLLWWFGLVIYTHWLLIRAYPSSSEFKKLQIRYFFLAIVLAFGTGSLAYLPFFHINVYPWGTFGIPLYPAIMSYAILEYQLLDINLAAKKTLISSVIVALIGCGLLIAGIMSEWLTDTIGIPSIAIALFGGAVALLLGSMVSRRARRFEELRYEFITVAAHRLRTPLTEIRWTASELEHAQSVDDVHTAAQQILSANDRLLALVNMLLRSVEVDAEFFVYTFETCDVRELAEAALRDHRQSIDQKHLAVSLAADPEHPLVRGDKERLSEVIQIFLENAILYTPENGSIAITLGSHNNDFIIFRIHDTGIGIDKNEREHLFTRLYRGKNALRASTEGTGLGLFMAREILRRHGGIAGAESPGASQGSTFWFTVPKAR